MYGRYFEELDVGKIYVHGIHKTITESDNNLFCLLTMNHHPLHLDEEYAKHTTYQGKVVVGTLIISLVVGMSVGDISGKAIANMGFSNIKHEYPVYIGDTIEAITRIMDKRISRTKAYCGIVSVMTRAYNQNGTRVLIMHRDILIPLKNR